MNVGRIIFGIAVAALLMPCAAHAQNDTGAAMLSMETTKPAVEKEPKVTAVYGLSADDYLPTTETARKHLRPRIRSRRSRPALDLPDAFYFIGGPIFIFLFLRVLVIFLNGFEEKRKEELRVVARDVWDAE
jgi:hypothetical protein